MVFTAPKNFKRGRLIGNKYRAIDLVIAISLIVLSISLILTYVLNGGTNIIIIMIFLFPCLIAALILIPLGFYHNLIQKGILWIMFRTSRRKWIWQGTYHYIPKDNDE